jgi:hypothetical protein
MSSAHEHRWRDITGPSIGDDPNWRGRGVAAPTFGDGTPASLTLGQIKPLAARGSRIVVWYEVFDGQGVGAVPVAPTPATTATLEVLTLTKDSAGNELWSVGAVLVAANNQRRQIEVELPKQGQTFVRISTLGGVLPDPGSIRVFADEAIEP